MEKKNEKILILDFGGQYTQLIARRVREQHIYSEVIPFNTDSKKIKEMQPSGIILSGGPASVEQDGAPFCDPGIFTLGIPVLGICYGMQLTAKMLGGKVKKAKDREYGRTEILPEDKNGLLKDTKDATACWMSHTWQVTEVPSGFKVTGSSANCPVVVMEDRDRRIYGVQFHPEVTHTEEGKTILRNFLYEVCGCMGDWTMDAYLETAVAAIRETVGKEKVLLALSGGVDSAVTAALIQRAIGDNLVCVFVDHGLLRKNESEQVCSIFQDLFPVRFVRVDAASRFFADLKGVCDPEEKRHIIGKDFIEVFREKAAELGKIGYFAQGTIYPDVIESGQAVNASVIKSHHNVGGLPAELGFTELIEPLRMLFKDEVRSLGEKLGLPPELVYKQPFPGPGLAVRVVGEVTPEKVRIVQESDAIFREEIGKAGLAGTISQYFTVLTGARSVGVMGDERIYGNVIALRAVTTDDFMTADWVQLPYDVVSRVSQRIVNEVNDVCRVVLDITSKPPASIEWE